MSRSGTIGDLRRARITWLPGCPGNPGGTAAIQACEKAEKHGPHACRVTGRGWNYVVSLDNSALGIRRVDARLAGGGWMGPWPFPVADVYSMERGNAEDIDSKRLDELTDAAGYIDDNTVVVE